VLALQRWRGATIVQCAARRQAARAQAAACRHARDEEAHQAQQVREIKALCCIQANVRRLLAARQFALACKRRDDKLHAAASEAWAAACYIQKYVRGMLARLQRQRVLAAATYIQASFRMVRMTLLRRRLQRALAFLKEGSVLAKYKQGGVLRGVQFRYVRLTNDETCFEWGPVPMADGSSNRSDVENKKWLPLKSVSAVSDGAKTKLMKKMANRESDPSFIDKAIHLMAPKLTLDGGQAGRGFSIIFRERTLDLVAPTRAARDQWLGNIEVVLTHKHTFDTAKLMTSNMVNRELHQMIEQSKKAVDAKQRAAEALRNTSNKRRATFQFPW